MKSDRPSDEGIAITSIPQSEKEANNQALALSDLSPSDKPWDKHRAFADTVESHYRGSEFNRYSERIHFCSELLSFGLKLQDDDTLRLKLNAARFCRVRQCPICQWRRSLKWKAKAYEVMPKIIMNHPNHRWLFLTLTIKNVEITSLRETLKEMNKGFQRLTRMKEFPAIGWLRSTEVTRGRRGDAHPHFHCLLLVKPIYFSGKRYIKQDQWVEMWRKAMKLDYKPVMDVRAVKEGSKPMELVPELLKYAVKETDLVQDREWLLEFTKQMHKMRCVATGGVLKEYLKQLEEEPEDLIGQDEDDTSQEYGKLYFGWKRSDKKYRMVSTDLDG